MRKLFLASLILVFWGLAGSVTYGETLPESIKEMVLKDVEFYEPINKSFTPQLFVSTATMGSVIFERDAELTGKGAKTGLWRTKFFIPNGYLKKVPTKSDRGKFDWGEYLQSTGEGVKDLVPTEKFQSHLKTQKGIAVVALAKRALKSIDYTNKWKSNDLDAWSFTYTYFLEPILPELPQLGPFTGKGTAMINPATGKFETATEKEVGRYGASLGDKGDQEYTAWVEKQSVKAEEKLPVKRGNTSQDSDCSRDRHEEAKTGKPMCDQYW